MPDELLTEKKSSCDIYIISGLAAQGKRSAEERYVLLVGILTLGDHPGI